MSLIQNRKTKRQVKRGYSQSASLLAHNTISCYRSISEGVYAPPDTRKSPISIALHNRSGGLS